MQKDYTKIDEESAELAIKVFWGEREQDKKYCPVCGITPSLIKQAISLSEQSGYERGLREKNNEKNI